MRVIVETLYPRVGGVNLVMWLKVLGNYYSLLKMLLKKVKHNIIMKKNI